MPAHTFFLLLGLIMILLAAEFFTNGIEAFGNHFSFSQAVVGSIFAAIGTALPETVLPIVAIFFYGGKAAKDIGVGAILGAPFMLSTLAFFLVGLTVTIAAAKKKRRFELKAEINSLKRDMAFFLVMYSTAIVVPLFLGKVVVIPVAIALVIGYCFYAWLTFRGESAEMEHTEEMYLWRLFKRTRSSVSAKSPPLFMIMVQIAAALLIMVKGAHVFVENLEHISVRLGMNPMLFALLLAPVATELPEKFNSITWTWKGRDILAIGNITGAMVFQSTFPVSVGLLFTEWKITGMALFSAAIAIVSALVVLYAAVVTKKISPVVVLFGGCLYILYVLVLILG